MREWIVGLDWESWNLLIKSRFQREKQKGKKKKMGKKFKENSSIQNKIYKQRNLFFFMKYFSTFYSEHF